MQFFTPISPYFLKETDDWEFKDAGFVSGILIGSYFLGRAVTHRCWIRGILDFGFRPVFLFVVIIETTSTFVIGMATNIYLSMLLRFVAGCFSPISAITALLVRRLNEEFGEDFPLVAGTLSFVSTLGMIIGYLISGCVAFPAENKIVDGSVFRQFPFLFAWLLNGCIMFLCLFCLCLELPDLLAEREKPKKVVRGVQPVGKLGLGKYAELTEQATAPADGQRIDSASGAVTTSQENPPTNQENPITERKEGGEVEEEELPGYLQCFELEEVHSAEIAAGGNGQMSHRSVINPSPSMSPRIRESIKPMTERQHVVSKIAIPVEEVKFNPIEKPAPFGSSHPPNRSEKTTFISFVEEDFQKALNSSKIVSLDDPYKRPPGEHRGPYNWSCSVAAMTQFIASWIEATFVLWVVNRTSGSISVELMGVVLAWSIAGTWLSMFTLSSLSLRMPLHYAFTAHSLLLILILGISALVPLVELQGVAWVLVVLCLVFGIRYCSTFMCSYGVLLVGDSGFLHFRTFIVLKAETWITLAKAAGYMLGPLLFTIGERASLSRFELSYLVASGLTLVTLGLNTLGAKHFPRFKDCPYAM